MASALAKAAGQILVSQGSRCPIYSPAVSSSDEADMLELASDWCLLRRVHPRSPEADRAECQTFECGGKTVGDNPKLTLSRPPRGLLGRPKVDCHRVRRSISIT